MITKTVLRVALLAVTAVIVSGCSDTPGDAEVRPFSEVQENDFVFEADPTNPSRGIFRVTTTEPMICAIIWGETEEFGNFNNSLAMNGTGIVQHDVFLPGAEPGVEYKFKVQGSIADGTLFESPVGTFTIPEVDSSDTGDVERGPNLALDATVVDVSSVFSETFAVENAIDGDTSTEWSTSGDGDDAYVEIELGSVGMIDGVEFITRSMADGTATTNEYTVTVNGETLGPFPAGTVADPNFTELGVEGQVLRFDVTSTTGGNTGAVEIRVYGPQN